MIAHESLLPTHRPSYSEYGRWYSTGVGTCEVRCLVLHAAYLVEPQDSPLCNTSIRHFLIVRAVDHGREGFNVASGI